MFKDKNCAFHMFSAVFSHEKSISTLQLYLHLQYVSGMLFQCCTSLKTIIICILALCRIH